MSDSEIKVPCVGQPGNAMAPQGPWRALRAAVKEIKATANDRIQI
jgi:hypothetical protein